MRQQFIAELEPVDTDETTIAPAVELLELESLYFYEARTQDGVEHGAGAPVVPVSDQPIQDDRGTDRLRASRERRQKRMHLAAGSQAADEGQQHRSPGDDSVSQYMMEIGRTPLLTKELERELAVANRLGRDVLSQLGGADPTPEQQIIIDQGKAAQERLITANLRWVVNMATHKVRIEDPVSYDLQDRIQEGNIGLIKSLVSLNPEKGRVTTRSADFIRRDIALGYDRRAHVIKIPEEVSMDLRSARRDAIQNDEPLPAEWQEIDKLVSHASLEKPTETPDGLGAPMADLLPGDSPDVGETVIQGNLYSEVRRLVRAALAAEDMPAISADLVIGHLGLYDGEPQTIKALSEAFGISRDSISDKIRSAMDILGRSEEIHDYLSS